MVDGSGDVSGGDGEGYIVRGGEEVVMVQEKSGDEHDVKEEVGW